MIYYEIDGKLVGLREYLSERNEKMFQELQEKADEIIKTSVKATGRMKMGNRLTTCLFSYFARQPMMSRKEYVELDSNDLWELYIAYMQVLEHYNIFEIPSTRQLFSAFCGFSVQKFIDLMNSSKLELKERAIMINDGFDGLIFSSAESSSNNGTATLKRARTKDAGQGHIMQEGEFIVTTDQTSNPEILMARAQAVLEAKKNQLTDGKK